MSVVSEWCEETCNINKESFCISSFVVVIYELIILDLLLHRLAPLVLLQLCRTCAPNT